MTCRNKQLVDHSHRLPLRDQWCWSIWIFLTVLFCCCKDSLFAQGIPTEGFSSYVTNNPLLQSPQSHDEANWHEWFESPGVSWRYLYRDKKVEVIDHRRTSISSHSGRQSEQMTVRFNESGYLFLAHYLDYPVIYDGMAPSMWLRADRPGITFGALVVLPQTIRPDTNTPLTVLVVGDQYIKVGDWQQLSFFGKFRQSFQRVIQSVRSEQMIALNTTGAYVRQIVLLVEGTRGTCSLQVDDLQVMEHLPCPYDVLVSSERNALFNPVNLLAFRLSVSQVSYFPDTEFGNSDFLGKEPFAVNPLERIEPVDFQQIKENQHFPILSTSWSQEESSSSTKAAIIVGSGTLPDAQDAPLFHTQYQASKKGENVRFRNRFLNIGDEPAQGIRAIEYQHEPLRFLKELGFNAVWLNKPPTASLLRESQDVDIWLISPPPMGEETVNTQIGFGQGGVPVTTEKDVLPYFNRVPVGPDYDSVLLWDLGKGHEESHLPRVRSAADLVRKLDQKNRPIICNISSGVVSYTYNNSDINAILIRRRPFLTSLDLTHYGEWLQRYTTMATPEFPFWNEIQTQPDSRLLAQSRFFGAVEEMPGLISYEQMRQQVRLSMAAGCHGLLFASDSPLNGTDHETQYRACALELLNLELMLTEPWFGGATSEEIVETSDSQFAGLVQQTKRTSLILPLSTTPANQYVMGQAAANHVKLIAPVREGYGADLLLPGSLRKVPANRRAGGIYLDLEEAGMNSIIFLTQADWYNQKMAEVAPQFGPRMSELAIRLTKMRVDIFEKTLTQIATLKEMKRIPKPGQQLLLDIPEQDTTLTQTRTAIAQAERLHLAKDYSQAYLQAERAGREIRMLQRRFWETATRYEDNRPVLPVSVSFAMLPAYLETYMRIFSREIKLSDSDRIQGGDMEDEIAWTAGNWIRCETKVPGITSNVTWDEGSAHSGKRGLRLIATNQENKAPAETEYSPVWLEVPIPVQTGELICVHGWIKIPKPITHSVDAVTISEDHGGTALALRFCEVPQWTQFAFYRYAVYDGEMRLTIAIHGCGEVWLDDVGAHVVR